MKSSHIWIIAGVAGMLIGATSMHFCVGEDSRTIAFDEGKQLMELLARMDQVESTLREMKSDISASAAQISTGFAKFHQAHTAANGRDELQPPPDTKGHTLAVVQGLAEIGKYAVADDEAAAENVMSRLRDPGYTSSTTLSEVMQSDDMVKLSPESRARVVSELVGMINRGEIDEKSFFAGKK